MNRSFFVMIFLVVFSSQVFSSRSKGRWNRFKEKVAQSRVVPFVEDGEESGDKQYLQTCLHYITQEQTKKLFPQNGFKHLAVVGCPKCKRLFRYADIRRSLRDKPKPASSKKLFHEVYSDRTGILRSLLSYSKKNIHVREEETGNTLLHRAAQFARTQMVKDLMKAGLRPETTVVRNNRERTAMDDALEHKNYETWGAMKDFILANPLPKS